MADGGVAFYLERFVSHRVLKYTYGTDVAIPFLPFLPEHKERANLVKMGPQGPMLIDAFSVILKKVSMSLFLSPSTFTSEFYRALK